MGSALTGSLQISCFLTEGLVGYSHQPIFTFPKGARAYLFPQSVKSITFAAAPLGLTPSVRNRAVRGGGRAQSGIPLIRLVCVCWFCLGICVLYACLLCVLLMLTCIDY